MRGCARVCIGRNPYNGFKYLCAAVPPRHIALLQWYDPLEKFMFIKVCQCAFHSILLLLALPFYRFCFLFAFTLNSFTLIYLYIYGVYCIFIYSYILQLIECDLPSPLLIFEMFIFPNMEFPFICVGVFKAYARCFIILLLKSCADALAYFWLFVPCSLLSSNAEIT